jgi:hypothetical protein
MRPVFCDRPVYDLHALLRRGVLSLLLSLALMPALSRGSSAEDAPQPLEFEVRPSGVEEETPEARLDRRLKQREFLFRSICTQCSRDGRFQSNAPFNPQEALRKPMPAE